MRHVTDEQIRKWSRVATTTLDGLMSKDDKKLLIKLSEVYPNLEEGDYENTINSLIERVTKLEETVKTAIYFKE